jgi:hypothetical protein
MTPERGVVFSVSARTIRRLLVGLAPSRDHSGVVNDLVDRYAFNGSSHIGRDILIGVVAALLVFFFTGLVARPRADT